MLAGISVAAYFPSLQGGFILDDDAMLTKNALVHSSRGIFRFWYTPHQPDYTPLTSSTLWLEWRLWGMNSTGYRVTNLALHIFSCLLLWIILQRLAIPGGFLAALLFAVHPVNVESVAWIEQRKNTLSMLFLLLSILCYLRADEVRNETEMNGRSPAKSTKSSTSWGGWYWFSLAAFMLAMCSKGSVAVLPMLLLLIVWWRHGRITKSDLFRAAPFFVVAAAITPIIIWFVKHDAGGAVRNATIMERVAGAGTVVWFYLSKAFCPIELILVYPQWQIRADTMLWWLPLLASAIVTLLLLLRCDSLLRTWPRSLWFAWAFYCVALMPVLGFTDSGYSRFSLVADHYQHLALLSVVTAVAAGWSIWQQRSGIIPHNIKWAIAAIVVGIFTFLTWQQSQLYASAHRLYVATVEKNPGSWMAHHNLGVALSDEGQPQLAQQQFEEAIRLNPDYADAHNSLGGRFLDSGRLEEAIAEFRIALALQENFLEAHLNYGKALYRLNRPQEAIEQFLQVLQLDPDHFQAHYDLGRAYFDTQQAPAAIEQFQEALRIDPEFVEGHYNIANAMVVAGQLENAIEEYQQLLRAKPEHYWAHNNLGVALAKTGKTAQAIQHFQEAVRIKPEFTDAWKNLAESCDKAGRTAEAIAAAQQALTLARSQGQPALAKQLEEWLNANRNQKGNE